jgi:signal transduction histidine kinase
VYALAWALIPVAPESEGAPRRPGAWLRALVTVLALLAALGGLRIAGLNFGEQVVWPLVVGVVGMALAWRLTGGSSGAWEEPGVAPEERRRGRGVSRVVLAALLVALAASALLRTFGVLNDVGREIGAVVIFATLLALLVVPWVARLARSLSSERAARIREQERAELAAHLHDSVLQTLALIQRRAGDAREVATLARRQERELRRWLFGRSEAPAVDSLKAELTRAAAEVEELHAVPVEVVVVGDGPLDPPRRALVQAAREALTNASKFAGSERVDLYAEIGPERVDAFVRDRGVGFDPAAVPADRAGVRDSILARMARNGGCARVNSAPGQGTEVELVLEQPPAAHEPAAAAQPGSP